MDHEGRLSRMVFPNGHAGGEISIVVTHRVHVAVLLVVRVEVAACAFEVRCITDCIFVDVDGVGAKGQILQLNLDFDALFYRLEGRRPCILPSRVENLHFDLLRSRCGCRGLGYRRRHGRCYCTDGEPPETHR